jgi:hypothetical protein
VNKRGTYTDSQSDVGGYPYIEENMRELDIPRNAQSANNNNEVSNLTE